MSNKIVLFVGVRRRARGAEFDLDTLEHSESLAQAAIREDKRRYPNQAEWYPFLHVACVVLEEVEQLPLDDAQADGEAK